METGQQVSIIGVGDWVFSVAFSPDGKILASADAEGDIELRDMTKIERAEIQPTSTPKPTPSGPTPTPVSSGSVQVQGVSIKVVQAYTEETLEWGESALYPDDPAHVLFVVVVDAQGDTAAWEGLGRNIRLVHDDKEYKAIKRGFKIGEGGVFLGDIFVFSVPRETEFAEYVLRLTDEVSIALSPFFQ